MSDLNLIEVADRCSYSIYKNKEKNERFTKQINKRHIR